MIAIVAVPTPVMINTICTGSLGRANGRGPPSGCLVGPPSWFPAPPQARRSSRLTGRPACP